MDRIIWTEKKIIEEAKKYRNRSEFSVACYRGYYMARRLGIIDEILPLHIGRRRIMKRPKKWTLSYLKEVSHKYDYRGDFMKENAYAYEAARIYGLLDILFEDKPNKGFKRRKQDIHLLPLQKVGRPTYWTKEKIIEEGRKYNTRLEFKNSCISAYQYAVKKRCLDEIFKDKPNKGYQKFRIAEGEKSDSLRSHSMYWTEERIIKTVYTWKDSLKSLCREYPGFSSSIDRLKLRPKIKEIRSRLYDSIPREQIEADAKKYASRKEFREKSSLNYWAARHYNIIEELFPRKKVKKI